MKLSSATSAALTTAVLTAVVALPATAATGSGSGGVAATPDQYDQQQSAQAATFAAARATWYGPGLFGHRTACGTLLTRRTLGVAHRRLPCGTEVALQYHGRTVVVPVIDRGPYSRGVDFDLTYATARKLGMERTSNVRAAALNG
jgi:rare lipoprotein A